MTTSMLVLNILACAAMFGFFYAWTVSTMWGLDTTEPQVAIKAMQAMNASVRNVYFGAFFFGTPVILVATTAAVFLSGDRTAALTMALAALVYIGGVFLMTVTVNVPMNETLARTEVPAEASLAARVWLDYSPAWQTANLVRTLSSGVALLLVILSLLLLRKG